MLGVSSTVGTPTPSGRAVAGQPGRVTSVLARQEIRAAAASVLASRSAGGRRKAPRPGPKQTLDACQSLYETHRLADLPALRLPVPARGPARPGDRGPGRHRHEHPGARPCGGPGRARPSLDGAWNDKKISAHHAIIPTARREAWPRADARPERAVYELVARRYLAQFYPPFEYHETKIELAIEGERFRASRPADDRATDGARSIPQIAGTRRTDESSTTRKRSPDPAPPGWRADRLCSDVDDRRAAHRRLRSDSPRRASSRR